MSIHSSMSKRVVISGMAINTPLGDTLDSYYDNLLAGKSAITDWKFLDTSNIHSKVGGDLSEYDTQDQLYTLSRQLPPEVYKRLRRLVKKPPFSTRLPLLCAADAFIDSGLTESLDSTRAAVIVGGHNLHNNLLFTNIAQFNEEPEYIDSMLSLHGLDTDLAASVGDALGLQGALYTVGGACASVNVALRNAIDEILHHDHDVAVVVGAPLDFSPIDLHAMAIMGAIGYQSFNDRPAQASRPYDQRREGFIPSHGTGVLILEDLAHAQRRKANIYAELLGVSVASDGCHLPSPSVDGQTRTMQKLLKKTRVAPKEVDYINAHATSTPLGDVTEIRSIKSVFGDHAYNLKINATKSMLGHCCWSAPVVETIGAILQLRGGTLHPSINIDDIDPEVDLDVCAKGPVKHPVRIFMKNAFGFGGINCCALYRSYEG
jgi:3-oxoacyl-(acyl-carrier-protein) synthase